MENISNKNAQEQSDRPQEVLSNLEASETECHIRNLILNTNITITTAHPQTKSQIPDEESKHEKENYCQQSWVSSENGVTPTKRQKFSIEISEGPKQQNPLASLPVSLISNGTLSVTSESACVAIENGIPILKEAEKHASMNKQANVSVTTIAPVLEIVPLKPGSYIKSSQEIDQPQQKHITSKTNEGIKSTKDALPRRTTHFTAEFNDSKKSAASKAQSQEILSINNIILKALTDVAKVTPFGKISLIPNPNQMDFLTLLGLEIVVNSFCLDGVPKYTESFPNQAPLLCGQCRKDFTTTWHFYKSPLQVLCDHCFTYNEHQIVKAAQTVRLAKEYTKAIHLKQKTHGMQFKVSDTINSSPVKAVCPTSTKLPTQQVQNKLFQDYVNAAGIFTNGSDGVNDLARLGAAIASNSEIFDAAKALNSLDSNSTPLLRAKAVQNFQIALFNGLHEKISPLNKVEMKDQTLLYYQMTIAQMVKQANVNALLMENHIVETPLAGIVRAINAQHHSLIKNVMKQAPKAYCGIEDKKFEKQKLQ